MKKCPRTRNNKRLFYSAPIFRPCPEFRAFPMVKYCRKRYKERADSFMQKIRNTLKYYRYKQSINPSIK